MSLYGPLLYEAIPGLACVPTDTLVNGVLYSSFHDFVAPFVMFIFVWLTYQNVKQSRQRVGVVAQTVARRSRVQFISMVFTQVIATSFFVLQWISVYTPSVNDANHINALI